MLELILGLIHSIRKQICSCKTEMYTWESTGLM